MNNINFLPECLVQCTAGDSCREIYCPFSHENVRVQAIAYMKILIHQKERRINMKNRYALLKNRLDEKNEEQRQMFAKMSVREMVESILKGLEGPTRSEKPSKRHRLSHEFDKFV